MKVALVAVLLLALAGCAAKPDMRARTVRYQADYPQYQTLETLFAAADLVAEVRLGAGSEVRGPTQTVPNVHTVFAATAGRTYKGTAPARLEIKQGGGRYKGTDHIQAGSVSLRPEGHYLVFLEVYDDAPASLLNPTQGQYRLDEAGTVTPVDAAGLRFTLADLGRLTP
ncbi:hypothetical protein Daura_49275 [Dactylosporangium aurantiacum]|uniref:Lipoprotein n=1 Tax=Dactylosporangium aurantiacum TaxID=35754 RepID=A0A9Q9IKB0_9ACTN|nr:hypothetical protein [Dactylosporangium aurantiacum]MDG6107576.1 hypothetical protein [Dactylosporangium aurantiacum]UWZ54360.1 hypothetical protein Daura_49275 [Dactylosporangium aurantiacum]